MRLSVAMAVYNEEENLDGCLKSVESWIDELVIVDGFSTDKTISIADKYKAKIISEKNSPIFHLNKQKAIEACTGDWILQLDADEIVSLQLKEEILNMINQLPKDSKQESIEGYWIPRKNFFLGKWLKKGGAYPDLVLRLFKKGTGHLPCESVHEQIIVKGNIGILKSNLTHLPYRNFSQYLKKADKYTDLTCQEMERKKLKINIYNDIKHAIVIPFAKFVQIYFRHLGFLDGVQGYIWALFSSLHPTIAYIKYIEQSFKNKHNAY